MTSPPGAPAPRPPSPEATGPPSTKRLIIIVAGVIGGIFLLIAGCLVLAAFLFVSNVHVSANPGPRLSHEDGVRIETPLGSLRVQKQREIDPKLLGLPLYPGAVSVQGEGLGARVDLDLDFADKSLRVAAI